MNEIVKNILLNKNKFMPELHFRQPGFTHSVCGEFTEHGERIQTSKETGDSQSISIKMD